MLSDDMELIVGVNTVLAHGLNNGYKNVIVTSDNRASTLKFIEKFKLEPYIFDVICGDDTIITNRNSVLLKALSINIILILKIWL